MAELIDLVEPQGANPHPVDATGRTTLKKGEAAAMRRALNIADKEPFELVVTRDTPHCLSLLTPKGWNTFKAKIDMLPSRSPKARQLRRMYLGSADVVTVDRQDRMKVSATLLGWAGIKPGASHATLAFVGDGWELWESEAYDANLDECEADVDQHAEEHWGDGVADDAAALTEDIER